MEVKMAAVSMSLNLLPKLLTEKLASGRTADRSPAVLASASPAGTAFALLAATTQMLEGWGILAGLLHASPAPIRSGSAVARQLPFRWKVEPQIPVRRATVRA